MIRFRYLAPFGVVSSLFALLAGCSSIEQMVSGDKVDYRSASTTKNALDVPPDLTQLGRDPRFQTPASGTVSASSFQSSASAVVATPAGPPVTVSAAPAAVPPAQAPTTPTPSDEAHIERAGSQRWLTTRLTPEQLWPQLRTFWQERGFNLVVDEPGDRGDGNRLGRGSREAPERHHSQHARQAARLVVLHRRARQVPHARRAHGRRLRGLHQPSRPGRGLRRHATRHDDVAAATRAIRNSRQRSCRVLRKSSTRKRSRPRRPRPSRRPKRHRVSARARVLEGPGRCDADGRRLRSGMAPRRAGARSDRLHGRGQRSQRRHVLRPLHRSRAGREGGARPSSPACSAAARPLKTEPVALPHRGEDRAAIERPCRCSMRKARPSRAKSASASLRCWSKTSSRASSLQ